MRRVVLALAISILAAQASGCSGGASGGAAAQQDAARRYHLAVSGMT